MGEILRSVEDLVVVPFLFSILVLIISIFIIYMVYKYKKNFSVIGIFILGVLISISLFILSVFFYDGTHYFKAKRIVNEVHNISYEDVNYIEVSYSLWHRDYGIVSQIEYKPVIIKNKEDIQIIIKGLKGTMPNKKHSLSSTSVKFVLKSEKVYYIHINQIAITINSSKNVNRIESYDDSGFGYTLVEVLKKYPKEIVKKH